MMRLPTRKHVVGVLGVISLVGAVMAAAVTTASGMPAKAAASAAKTTYTDPAGDTQGGPDVTTVVINVDPTTGTIQAMVTAPGLLPASPDAFERQVNLWLDTDRNINTGDPEDGTDYGLVAWTDPTGRWWDVVRWDGNDWVSIPQSPTMNFGRSGDVLTWTVNAKDLGGATSFRFYIHACTWDPVAEEHIALDNAPDGANDWWSYDISGTTPAPPTPVAPATKVKLVIAAPKTVPLRAVAGKRLTVSFRVSFWVEKPTTTIDIGTGETRSGTIVTFVPAKSGKMVCDPSVGGKVIPHSESLKGGQARLSFVIPKTANGKLLKVRVKITATEKESGKTMTATKIATFRVR